MLDYLAEKKVEKMVADLAGRMVDNLAGPRDVR
jgi:hypothetical protein